jgi:hypothetical protein
MFKKEFEVLFTFECNTLYFNHRCFRRGQGGSFMLKSIRDSFAGKAEKINIKGS